MTDSPAATASTVRYTVRFQNWPEGNSALVQEGDVLVDNVRNYELGQVVSFEVVPAVSRQLDHEGRKYVQATYEGYEDILVTVDLADFGSAVGTYTVPAEVTVLGRDVGVSGGPYRVRVTISEQTADQPAEPDVPAGENPDTGDETT